MVLATCPGVDQSASIIRQNMAKIKLLTVAGPLLCHPKQTHRIVRLLANRRSWGIERPLVMLVQPGGEKYPFLQRVCPLHRSRNLWQSQGVVISARLY